MPREPATDFATEDEPDEDPEHEIGSEEHHEDRVVEVARDALALGRVGQGRLAHRALGHSGAGYGEGRGGHQPEDEEALQRGVFASTCAASGVRKAKSISEVTRIPIPTMYAMRRCS